MDVEEFDKVEFDVKEVDVDGLQQKVSATNFVKYKANYYSHGHMNQKFQKPFQNF